MQTITTIGLDIAKSVFQVHGVDAGDRVVIRRQLKRRSVLGILSEAATMPSWHRGLRLVSLFVARTSGTRPYRAIDAASLREAYVKWQKNDMADADRALVDGDVERGQIAHHIDVG